MNVISKITIGKPNMEHLAKTRFEKFKNWVWPMKFSDAVMILLTVFIAVGTIASAIAIGFQWHEMHEGGKQTESLIAAARINACAAKSFAASAKSINTEIAQTEQDFSTMAGNSAAAIKATQDQMRLDQRAWVGIKSVRITQLSPQEKMKLTAILVNTGKTFALKVVVDGVLKSNHTRLDIDEYAKSLPPVKPPSVSTLFPGLAVAVPAESDQIINEATINAIKAGAEYVYFFGDISYDDIFGKRHVTRFCYTYYPPEGDIRDCNQHNYAN